MLVSELMTDSVISIAPDEPASLAARLLYRHNIGAIPVCSEDGRLQRHRHGPGHCPALCCRRKRPGNDAGPRNHVQRSHHRQPHGRRPGSCASDVRGPGAAAAGRPVRKACGDAVAGRYGENALVRHGSLKGAVGDIIESEYQSETSNNRPMSGLKPRQEQSPCPTRDGIFL